MNSPYEIRLSVGAWDNKWARLHLLFFNFARHVLGCHVLMHSPIDVHSGSLRNVSIQGQIHAQYSKFPATPIGKWIIVISYTTVHDRCR